MIDLGRLNLSAHRRACEPPPVSEPAQTELITGGLGADPALEVALAGALLEAVAGGHGNPALRLYSPPPTVAFGRQDRFLGGFPAAAAAARAHGFTPVVRAPGGHAAGYDQGALVIDEVRPERDSLSGIRERFAENAERHARALRRLGVDAEIGRIPGEYCPGDFTVSARGETKLIGTAQRIVRGAWLFSTVVIVEGSGRLRPVLEAVYAALGLSWNPRTVGAVADEASGVGIAEVQQALLEGYEEQYVLVPSTPRPEIVSAAQRSIDRYRIEC